MGFVTAGYTAQEHPILLELHQAVVPVKTADRLPQPIEHTPAETPVLSVRSDGAMCFNRLGIVRDHVLLLLLQQPPLFKKDAGGARCGSGEVQEACRYILDFAKFVRERGLVGRTD
jgi:hypothetical protein